MGQREFYSGFEHRSGGAPASTHLKARVVMANTTHPSKQEVRAYMQRRSHDAKPPPSPEAIRRELGWELVKAPATRI
jgi:hypothetical protein